MSVLKDSFSVFGTRISMFALGMVSSIIVTRLLGPSYRGMLEILMTVPALMVNVGSLGIGNANLYFVAKEKYSLSKVVANSNGVVIVLGFFLFSLAFAAYYLFYDILFKNIPFSLALIAFSLIPLFLYQKLVQYTLLGKQNINLRNMIIIFQGGTNFVLVVCLLCLFKIGISGVLLASLISYMLTSIFCTFIVSRKTPVGVAFDLSLTIEAVKFGIVPFAALAVMNLIYKSDVFILKYFLSDAELGYYGLSVSLSEKLWMVPQSIGLVIFSRIAGAGQDDKTVLTAKACRIALFISFVSGALLYVFVPVLLPFLYGEEFVPAIRSFRLLLPGIELMAVFLILHGDLTGRGKAIYSFITFGICLLINILLNCLLVPEIGIEGAAISSSLTYGGGAMAIAVIYSKKYRIPITQLLLIRKDDLIVLRNRVTARMGLTRSS